MYHKRRGKSFGTVTKKKGNQRAESITAQSRADMKAGEYTLGGGVVNPLPKDAPYFVRDYYDYYKTDRGYRARSLNSNGG